MLDHHKLLTLRRNLSWSGAGNLLYAAAQWGMLTALAKMSTPQMVGQFALGLAITAPVIMFANLNLQAVQATDARHEYRFGDYLALRLVTTTLALVLILGIVLIVGYRRETALVILIIGLAKAFESISDVLYGLLLRHERIDRIAKSMIIKGVLSLVALSLGVYFTGSIVWGVIGLALAWALVLFVYDIRNGVWVLEASAQRSPDLTPKKASSGSLLRPHWILGTMGKLAWLALPLGIVMALISLNINVPRYFVEWHLGERELGIFAAMAYVLVAGSTLVNALGQAASPRLANYYAAGNSPEFRSLLLKLGGVGVLLGTSGVLVVLVAGTEILTLLYTPEYAEYSNIFFWLMVAGGLSYVASFLGYGMTAARYFRIQVPLFGLSVCASAMVCFWLVPVAGLLGAAIALIVSAAVQLCGSLVVIVYAILTSHPVNEKLRV